MSEGKKKRIKVFYYICKPLQWMRMIFQETIQLEIAAAIGQLAGFLVGLYYVWLELDGILEAFPLTLFIVVPMLVILFLIVSIIVGVFAFVVSAVGLLVTFLPMKYCEKYDYMFKQIKTFDDFVKLANDEMKFNTEKFDRSFTPRPSCWKRLGEVLLAGNDIFCDHRYFSVADLESAQLIGYPKEKRNEKYCLIELGIEIRTSPSGKYNGKTIKMKVGEVVVRYHMSYQTISFYYPDEAKEFVDLINRGIKDRSFEKVFRKFREESNKTRNERRGREEWSRAHYHNSNPHFNDEVKRALEFFGLKMDFTTTELKKRFHKLSKEFHPDSNNSQNGEYQKVINIHRDVLENYLKNMKMGA